MRKNYQTQRVILIIVSLGMFAFMVFQGISAGYLYYIQKPVDSQDSNQHIITITRGETIDSVGKKLKSEGLIRNTYIFYIYIRQKNLDEKVRSGRFILQKNFSLEKIVSLLTNASLAENSISIIEGWTIFDIDKKLTELKLIKTGEFIEYAQNYNAKNHNLKDYPFLNNIPSIEGFIFPDTYFIDPKTFTLQGFIRQTLDNFQKKLKKVEEKGNISTKHSFYENIIMASILEKEVRTNADRAIVAGILWKRLENNWTLGADATLLYATKKNTITSADLDIDSPYNTRKYRGLPPTPISNPGLESIISAFSPEKSPYWFYLTKPDTGEVVYAITNEEQNLNKQKYLR
ncbi:endolytic transglycosylase MltG [Candidatus Peregrinibacteria bacterium]|nr:endolytic transglycosylase MltG [Candidatus Peregrinibacteria bacterium]